MSNNNDDKSNINSSIVILSNTLTKTDDIKEHIIKKGETILEENDFFKKLESTMHNTEFRSFYNKYFKDYSDIKTIILYMKLYETIETEYNIINGYSIEKEFLAYIIKELMCNDISRKNIIKTFENYTENKQINKKYLLDIFDMDNMNKKYTKNKLEYNDFSNKDI